MQEGQLVEHNGMVWKIVPEGLWGKGLTMKAVFPPEYQGMELPIPEKGASQLSQGTIQKMLDTIDRLGKKAIQLATDNHQLKKTINQGVDGIACN